MNAVPVPRLIFRYNSRLSLLRLWRGEMQSTAQLVNALNTLLAAVRRHQARQLLLNMQQLPPFDQTLQEWLQTNWLPRLRRSGIHRLALLLPQDVYNRMVIEGLLWNSTRKVLPYEVQYFTELEAALDWVSDAELPTTSQDWPRWWHQPTLLRLREQKLRRGCLR
jgi:SpoIIAA-like